MRARDAARSLRAFADERASVPVAGALALALCAGPWALARGDGPALTRAALVLFFVLLALRIVDDLCSVAADRLAHPGRGLPSGRIATGPLAAAAATLYAAALLVGGSRLAPGLLALGACYAAHYSLADRIPLVVRPALVNAVFGAIPFGVARLVAADARGGADARAVAALALTFWLAAVGHDVAHEVHAQSERPPGPPTVSATIGPRAAALAALGCYVAAFAAGVWSAGAVAARMGPPRLFVASLAVLSAGTLALLAALVARPCHGRARRLYVVGVLAFAVPSLMLGLDRLLSW